MFPHIGRALASAAACRSSLRPIYSNHYRGRILSWRGISSHSSPASSGTAAPAAAKAVSEPSAAKATKTVENAAGTSASADTAKIPAEAAKATEQATVKTSTPDIGSTSLGLEDPDANDPLKWRKFAWKYAGAVAVFFVAYKSLHWYIDRLEAEGKKRRQEVEENKEIVRSFEEDKNRAQNMLAAAQNPSMPVPNGREMQQQAAQLQQQQQQQQQPAMLFKPIQEEDFFVSELDELRTLQVELEARLKILNAERRETEETAKEKWELQGELKDLEKEIAELERTEAKKEK